VLSFRSSFHASGLRSSTTAQWTLSRNSSISGSCLVTVAPHAEVQERSFLALVPSLPCPRRQPQDGQAARARGTRGSLRTIILSFASPRKSWEAAARREITAAGKPIPIEAAAFLH
jgi:hypothetical protein